MKNIFLPIIAFFFAQNVFAQIECNLIFPDSIKKSTIYFSPVLPYSTIPVILGFKKSGEPFDSIKYIPHPDNFHESEDTNRIIEDGKSLTISIDTSQEIDRRESFLKSSKDYNWYNTPRKFKTVSTSGEIKTFVCDRDSEFLFKAYPVAVSNFTNFNKSVYIKEFGVEIIQEAMDKYGDWKPVEISMVFMCGMGFYWKDLEPGEQIITTVWKYKGDYKTMLRLKLVSGNKIVYSKPFRGSINYTQFDLKKIHYIDWLPYEK